MAGVGNLRHELERLHDRWVQGLLWHLHWRRIAADQIARGLAEDKGPGPRMKLADDGRRA